MLFSIASLNDHDLVPRVTFSGRYLSLAIYIVLSFPALLLLCRTIPTDDSGQFLQTRERESYPFR